MKTWKQLGHFDGYFLFLSPDSQKSGVYIYISFFMKIDCLGMYCKACVVAVFLTHMDKYWKYLEHVLETSICLNILSSLHQKSTCVWPLFGIIRVFFCMFLCEDMHLFESAQNDVNAKQMRMDRSFLVVRIWWSYDHNMKSKHWKYWNVLLQHFVNKNYLGRRWRPHIVQTVRLDVSFPLVVPIISYEEFSVGRH